MKQTLHSIFLFLILFIGQVNYVKGDTTIASGTIDNSEISWAVTSADGTQENLKLSLIGSGEIPDFLTTSRTPWYSYRSQITSAYIASGITRIGKYTFGYTNITSVEIPSACASIGINAFIQCTDLKEVYIPSSVTSIGNGAFSGCSSLSLIHFDGRCTESTHFVISGVAANGKFIEKEGTGDSHANVPKGWDYYTHGEKCSGGAWVAETEDKTKVFFYAKNPNSTVDEGSSDQVSWRVNCYKHTSLEINRNITSISNDAFLGYDDIDVSKNGWINLQTITVEEGNTRYAVGEEGALYADKVALMLYPATSTATHVELPPSVSTIQIGAFYGAKNLQSITFNRELVSIRKYAFAYASSLRFIYFASDVEHLFANATAFIGVPSEGIVAACVDTEDFRTFTSQVGANWTFDASPRTYTFDGTLYVVGSGAYTTPSSSASWYSDRNSINKIVVEKGVTNIGTDAFSGCSNVTEVTLNNNGTIGNFAFSDCTSLTRVNIGTGVTGLSSSYPFVRCANLSTINISDFVSFNAIENLKYLTDSEYGTAEEKTLMINGTTHPSTDELVVPEGVTVIKNEAIRYFKNVTKINIPSTVTEIQDRNFVYCKYLTEINLPLTVTSVGDWAFRDCTGLQTVTINNGSIGNGAFYDCTSLTRVNIGSGLIEFEYEGGTGHPFRGCSNLVNINISDFNSFNDIKKLIYLTDSYYGTPEEKILMVNGTALSSTDELVIPEGVTEINNEAIRYFKNVTKINFPLTVTEITNRTFEYCKYLTEITVPSTVTTVGGGAFRYCTGLRIVTLNNKGSVGGWAFNYCTSLFRVNIGADVTKVDENAFANCENLRRIVTKAITPPSTTGSIASNPSEIQLKVTNSSSVSAYQAANYWKEFNIIGPQTSTEDRPMYVLETLDLKGLALEYGNPLSWSIEGNDETVATVDNNGVVTSKNFIYDGSTSLPYKTAKVIVNLEDGDTFICNVNVYPREIVLTDGNAYKNTVYYMPERITYTRTFSSNVAGKWQCFYVPFDIKITEELLENFDFAKLYMVSYMDENNNDEIDDTDPLKMMFNKLSVGKTLHANMPYFVRAKSACTKTFEVTNAALNAAENGSVRCCTTEHEYSLIGVYETTNIKGKYSMNTNGKFVYCPSDANIKANRWYMEVKSLTEDGAALENYAHPIEIYVDGEDETTGIVALEDKASAKQNDKIYTLDGRQVTNTNNLPSGIYIVNGKKMYKK